MKPIILGAGPDGDIALDLPKLIRTKLLLQANSGGGKSWAIRRLLEQTFGHLQHIVVDPEGEFASLRERFDYVLAAPSGGDTAIDVGGRRGEEHTRLLAHRLLELNASAILDIYELAPSDRARFVRIFFDAMVNAPKALWHPVLIILDEAHQFCLDEETEILTREGWRRHDQIEPGTDAVAFHVGNADYRYETITKVIRKQHDGKMVVLKSDGIDCHVTPEHRVVLRREQRASGRRRLYDWTFCQADEVPHHSYVPIGGAPAGSGVNASDDLLRLIGWVVTDGCFAGSNSKGNKNRYLGITQSRATKKRGRSMVSELDDLLTRLGSKGRYERMRTKATAPVVDYYLGRDLSSIVLAVMGTEIHRIPRSLITGCSRSQLEALMQGLLEGDGTARRDDWITFYAGLNEGLADDFQEIALRLGMSASKKLVPQNQQWVVLISRRRHHYIRKPAEATYSGTVWCVMLPSGAFVARRRGKVFVTGNCPQSGEAESSKAVMGMSSKGRKRGFCLVPATQRLSKLSKDVAAEANNKLIGRSALDVDMKRAAEELGFTTRDQMQELRRLEPGQFFAFGPAMSYEVTLIRIGPVATTHPEAGAQAIAPPAPTAKIRALLPRLADLPAEAETEARTNEQLRRDLTEARRKLTIAEKAQPVPKPCGHESEIERLAGQLDARGKDVEEIRKWGESMQREWSFARGCLTDVIALAHQGLRDDKPLAIPEKPPAPDYSKTWIAKRPEPRQTIASVNGHRPTLGAPSIEGITGGALRMLQRLAERYPETWTRAQLATLARIKRSGGTFSTYYSRLNQRGLIVEEGGRVAITEDGLALMGGPPDAPQSHADLIASWRERLSGGARRMFDELLDAGERGLTREELAERAEIAQTGGTFSTYLSRLMTNGLVERRGDVIVATDLLLGVL